MKLTAESLFHVDRCINIEYVHYDILNKHLYITIYTFLALL